MTIIPFPGRHQGRDGNASDWLTLPVAPQAFARSRFGGEDKLPEAIPFQGALNWIEDLQAQGRVIGGLKLDGPGDPLATVDMTRDILGLLRQRYPELPVWITTLGFGLAEQAENLSLLGVTKVTLLVDSVNPGTLKNLYSWIRPGKRNVPLEEAAAVLVDEQTRGIAACKEAGIETIVQTAVYSGVNEMEIEAIAAKLSDLGVESMVLCPGMGWLPNGEALDPLPVDGMEWLVLKAEQYFDSVFLQVQKAKGDILPIPATGATAVRPTAERPNAAVLSSNGMDIDLHLGQAIKAIIYGPREDGLACLLEARDLPEPGGGDKRWLELSEILKDCFVLLAASAGQKPREILSRNGLSVLLIEDNVEGTVDVLYGGGKKGKSKKI